MQFKRVLISISTMLFLISPSAFAGDNEAVKTMANILMHLNHFPSDSEKQQLVTIADTTMSSDVKTVAQAMVSLQHSASSEDKRKLQKVISDPAADKNIKVLASIVQGLNHKPTNADKQQLSTMISFANN